MASLPKRLGPEPRLVWEHNLLRSGLGGIAATEDYVLFGDRDAEDFHDVWRCLDADTGRIVWEVKALAIGALDYGNSPRATPLIARAHQAGHPVPEEDRAYLLGAMGNLLCVNLQSGEIVWQRDLHNDFDADRERPWGYCGSPLLVDDRLIVNPGAAGASIVALDPIDGEVLWKTAGENVGYGSFNVAKLGGKRQIIGYDATTLGGWDIESGDRLWTLVPPIEGDFNVPTPQPLDERLLVTTENNGTRLCDFDDRGKIKPEPVAVNQSLKPNMSTPVVLGGRLFCVDRFLYCLDATSLETIAKMRDKAYGDYAALLASDERLLVVGKGEILLFDTASLKIVSRWQIFEEKTEIYSHAAIAGERLFVRGESAVKCIALK